MEEDFPHTSLDYTFVVKVRPIVDSAAQTSPSQTKCARSNVKMPHHLDSLHHADFHSTLGSERGTSSCFAPPRRRLSRAANPP